jgi:hypothetical protein
MSVQDDRVRRLRDRLRDLERERAAIEAEIAGLDAGTVGENAAPAPTPPQPSIEPAATLDQRAKVELFLGLFRGRADVFPRGWENHKAGKSGYAPACANEWKHGICDKPHVKCSACPNQAFLPVTERMVAHHLRGQDPDGAAFVAGVYSVLPDDTCWFLAVDFDEADWRRDVQAFAHSCWAWNVPVSIERSRSGNGAHAWIFFEAPVAAALARRLGSALITETLDRVPDIGFASYDRLFPSQDSVPDGGFGNLIALPLQGLARRAGNSLILDETLNPHEDQWGYLAGVRRLGTRALEDLVEAASAAGRILAVRIPVDGDDEAPWMAPPSRRRGAATITGPVPNRLTVVIADQIYVPRAQLLGGLVARLMRLAAFQNLEFYAAQAMRLATHDKPRIVSCAELTANHIGLPRGCQDVALDLLASLGRPPGRRRDH